MTEQELRTSIMPCIMAGNTWFVFDEIKAYADAREKAKDTEIAYWKDRWEAGNKFQDAAFNSEIENYHEVKRLNAEIKRLREGIQDAVDWLNNPDDNVDFDELLQSLLSPAPVTETKLETTTDFKLRNRPRDTTDILSKNEDQE